MDQFEPEAADSIWAFALSLYRLPGVEADCLTAQDRYGLDVLMLIFALFRARAGQGFDVEQAHALTRQLSAQLVAPLRQRRRAWKADPPHPNPEMIKALRAQLLAAELASEQTILQVLHSSDIKGLPLNHYDGLIACVRAAGVSLDADLDAVLKRLAQAALSL